MPIHLRVVLSLILIGWMRYYYFGNGAILETNSRTPDLHPYMHWINQRKQLPAAYFGLCTLIKWDFALDHYNHSKWLTVYQFNLVNLEQQHPDVYENSCKGYFSFSKSCSEFSTMALEQLHEQNNEIIKGVGMATRLLHREEESALLHWELWGSEIVNMIRSFEESINPTPSTEEFRYKKPPRRHRSLSTTVCR